MNSKRPTIPLVGHQVPAENDRLRWISDLRHAEEIETFVNQSGFRVYDPECEWFAHRLWEQMARLAPKSYIADSTVFTFATRNGDVFIKVISAYSARG